MTWTAIDRTLPDGADAGVDVVADTRNNQNAIYFMSLAGGGYCPGFDKTTNPSPDPAPTEYRYRRGPAATSGSIWLRKTMTYSSGLPTKVVHEISENGGTTYQPLTGEDGNHVKNITWSGTTFTGVTWSAS